MKKKHEKKENFVTRDDIYNNKRIHVYKILLWIQAGRQPTSQPATIPVVPSACSQLARPLKTYFMPPKSRAPG